MMLPLILVLAAVASPISADRIKADVKALSSDAFAGRGPGEAGEERAIAYIANAFRAAGLEPAGDRGGWYQDVPLVRLDRQRGATMMLTAGGRAAPLVLGRDVTLALRNGGETRVDKAPVVFAGYGVVDPARGWDAYAGVNMTGKVALLLANDPDFDAGADLGFGGRRMAYPGRFGAKVEAAAKAGAIAVLVIHEDAAASYPFAQVASGDALPAFALAPLTPSAFKASGWLRGDLAVTLFGLDLAAAKVAARNPAFRASPIAGATLSLAGTVKATAVTSHNVVGRLPGATRPDEALVYGAHWDANGLNGPDATGDGIRNGAIDNAAGTAELIEIARAFGRGKRPARTVIFAAWTAEEKGLLGSDYYAAHPLHPLATTAAMLNLDPHVVLPAARDIELIGGGRTPLEAALARLAGARGLKLVPEPAQEAGWYYRSDQFSFAKRGVPALTFRAGRDLVAGGRARGEAIVAAYNARCYHQPCDQFDPAWRFAGTAQEADLAYALGREIADAATWPGWNPDSEFSPHPRRKRRLAALTAG